MREGERMMAASISMISHLFISTHKVSGQDNDDYLGRKKQFDDDEELVPNLTPSSSDSSVTKPNPKQFNFFDATNFWYIK